MFLRLHYTSGRPFLVNSEWVAGIEANGTEGRGCVLTMMRYDADGTQKYECVKETLNEISGMLGIATTV